jgi:hypothetical protein
VFRDVPPEKTAREAFGDDLLRAVRLRMLTERNWDVYPQSESSQEFRKRAINAIESAIARNAGERIAIVCHGGVINAYMGHIIGSRYDMFYRPRGGGRPPPCPALPERYPSSDDRRGRLSDVLGLGTGNRSKVKTRARHMSDHRRSGRQRPFS